MSTPLKRCFSSLPGFFFRTGVPLLTIPLVLACIAGGDREAQPGIGHPVLLILVDGLRADHLGSYGYGKPTSPHLDRLAAEGVRFEQAVSPSGWTLPAVSSLFTSLYPIQHGVLRQHERQGEIQPVTPLAGEHRTLAERLASAGYRTVSYVANPFLNRQAGFVDTGMANSYTSDASPEGQIQEQDHGPNRQEGIFFLENGYGRRSLVPKKSTVQEGEHR